LRSGALAFINNRGFGTDALFIRTKTTVRAQSAQSPPQAGKGNRDIGRNVALKQ
jgi:hypothetical protein